MTDVLYDFFKQRLSVQLDFNLLDRKLNEINTNSKAYIIERLELLTKINYISTNAHPDAIRYLIREIIEIGM